MNYLKNAKYLFIIAAVVLFIGDLLPWVNAGIISANGIDTDDGTLVLWWAIGLLIAGFLFARFYFTGLIVGALLTLFALCTVIYDIHQTSRTEHSSFGTIHMSTGAGLYICLLGALVGIYATFVGIQTRRRTLVNA